MRHASPSRGASMRPPLQQQQPAHQLPTANDVMPGWQHKLQLDFDRYSRIGRQGMSATGRQSLSSSMRQKPLAYRQQSLGSSQGLQASHNLSPGSKSTQVGDGRSGGPDRSLQGARSMDRHRRLVRQKTADVVPCLDSLSYGPAAKQALPVREGTLGRRGQSSRASAPPWTAAGLSTHRLSPSRFAEREQEPLLAPGLGQSQRIGAVH